MKNNLLMNFVVDKDNNKIRVEREFAANVPLVWRAFTEPKILDQWWAPKPWKTETKSMDFRVGGRWMYAMVGPEGERHWCLANYDQIEMEKMYAGADGFCDAEGVINNEMPVSHWEVNFNGKENHTLVKYDITYTDLAQLEATIAMGFKEGLTMAMENLDALIENQSQSI
jgi:uncharacterized protein YndB with AHSA1/START domain